jgi:hypothetical protein
VPLETLNNKDARISSRKFLAHHTDKIGFVKRRASLMRRPLGRCYVNAWEEFKLTGNPMAYGLIDAGGFSSESFGVLCPHAFNYDKKTGQYYDTTELPDDTPAMYVAFIITEKVAEFYKKDLTRNIPLGDALDQTFGSYVWFFWKGKTYMFHAKDHQHNDDNEGMYKHMTLVEVL